MSTSVFPISKTKPKSIPVPTPPTEAFETITMAWEFIEPEEGIIMLANPASQRLLRPSVVNKYLSDMISGNWWDNGDLIHIDEFGKTANGQHRLEAMVKSGKGRWFLVMRGLPSKAMRAIDAGIGRTYADYLRINGEGNHSNDLASATRIWWNYQYKFAKNNVMSHTVLDDLKAKHNDALLLAVELLALAPSARKLAAKSVLIFCIAAICEYNVEKAKLFLDLLNTGSDLQKGNAILALRNTLINISNEPGESNKKQITGLIIKTFNAWSYNLPYTFMRYSTKKEEFPIFFFHANKEVPNGFITPAPPPSGDTC